MTTDITELTSVQKNANIHRLSRLIAYAPNDELRQLAVEVEHYTDQLIEALEHYKSREERVTNLVHDNSKSWNELYQQVEAKDKRNAELVEALEKAQRANGYLREQSAEWERKAISNFEDCAEMSARVEELESQRKLAFTASNRWADKFREAEKRIAELEFRSVTVKLPPKIERNDADGWFMYNCGRVGGGAAEWYNKALDDVGAELTAAGIKVEAE